MYNIYYKIPNKNLIIVTNNLEQFDIYYSKGITNLGEKINTKEINKETIKEYIVKNNGYLYYVKQNLIKVNNSNKLLKRPKFTIEQLLELTY